ncbi:MAG: Fe-S protein assembly co-chaperone HscB [Pseudomonadota bacterium]
MQPSAAKNHFELFELPVTFDVDQEALSLRYRELQRAVHPDRFANASDQEKRLSVQQAALINEAYQTLKTPLARARYLLQVNGIELDDSDTSMAPAFLMEQMELREALAAVRDKEDPFAELNRLRDQIEATERELVESLRQLFEQGTELEQGKDLVRRMQFIQRLLGEVDELEEALVHDDA